MKRSIPIILLTTVMPFALFAVTGCGGPANESANDTSASPSEPAADTAAPGESSAAANGEPVEGDWIVGRLPVEPGHLNIVLDTSDVYGRQVTAYVFESLLTRDPETLEFEPWLAESWEESDDHLVYTFNIDPRARFSDGEPVTAEDVEWSFAAIMNPENETADLRNYYQKVENVELVGERTIRFTCSEPYFKNLAMLSGIPVYPKHIYEEGDFNTHPNNRKPVGSGPYVFESWDTNEQIVLRHRDDYWWDRYPGYADKMVFKIIVDDNAAFQVMSQEQVDYSENLMPEQWVTQASRPEFEAKFNKHTMWGPSGWVGNYNYIAWNLRNPKFQDKRVRKALTMLLDRKTIFATIFYDLGTVVSGPSAYQTDDYDKSIEPWPFDPERANALLDEAGWVDSNQNGIRDKDGEEFRFEYKIPAGTSEYEQLATVYKEELDRAGIDVTIRVLEWATFLEDLTNREFDAATLSWGIPVDQDLYQVWHSSQTENGSNYPGYKSDKVDQLLEEARLEFDSDKRSAIYREIHAILHEEQPYTFMFNRERLVAVHNRFKGVQVYPLGLDQREWWAPAAQQRY